MILVLRALGIGDLCVAVPALRGLRAAYPDDEMVLAAPAWLGPLAALTGAVDRLLPQDELEPPQWSFPSPRLGVNLHGCGPQSHQLLAAARPRRLLGYLCPGFPNGPHWSEPEHEVHRWCRLLSWYGIPTDPADLRLMPPPGAGVPDGVTIVHPGAKAASRRWPVDRFGAVARELAAAGHRVVVTGSAAERALARSVAAGAGLPATAVLAGRLGLAGLAALVARARLVVCGDTGVGHLATGYGTPSVLLFGPAPPAAWGPPGGRCQNRVIWHGEVAGAATPDAPDAPHPALDAVTVAEVLTEVAALDASPFDTPAVNASPAAPGRRHAPAPL